MFHQHVSDIMSTILVEMSTVDQSNSDGTIRKLEMLVFMLPGIIRRMYHRTWYFTRYSLLFAHYFSVVAMQQRCPWKEVRTWAPLPPHRDSRSNPNDTICR